MAKDYLKDFKNNIVDAEFVANKKQTIISVSPAIDIGLNGGIPEGSWVILSGKEKCGKSTLALHLAAKFQSSQYGKRKVFYGDVEHRLKPMNLQGIKGLDLPRFKVIQSKEGEILSAEDHLNLYTNIIKTEPESMLIIDSSSALCSSKELTEDITGSGRAMGPRLLAQFTRINNTIVPIQRCIVVIIQHLIANTSGYGVPFMEDGGHKIQYQNDVKLRCKGVEKWKVGELQIGQVANWEVHWSALGPPGAIIKNYLRYGIGVDEITELIEIGTEFGLIGKAGAWFNCDWLVSREEDKLVKKYVETTGKPVDKAFKFQGQENLYQFLSENPYFAETLYSDIKGLLK